MYILFAFVFVSVKGMGANETKASPTFNILDSCKRSLSWLGSVLRIGNSRVTKANSGEIQSHVSTMTKQELEEHLRNVAGGDFQDPSIEEAHYRLMDNYRRHLPVISSYRQLVDEGILVNDGNGFAVSRDNVLQGTNLGALSFTVNSKGEVDNFLANRGTTFFTGGERYWEPGVASAGGTPHSTSVIRSEFAKQILSSDRFACLIVVPRNSLLQANKDWHMINRSDHVNIGAENLHGIEGVRVFRMEIPTTEDIGTVLETFKLKLPDQN